VASPVPHRSEQRSVVTQPAARGRAQRVRYRSPSHRSILRHGGVLWNLQQLGDIVASAGLLDDPVIKAEVDKLSVLNWQLWEIEEQLRSRESLNRFDDEFVQLARSVYLMNDARAAAKRRINLRCGSRLVEEKSYKTSSTERK